MKKVQNQLVCVIILKSRHQIVSGYNGSYFVKNGEIWIHDIDYLRSKFDNCSDEELERKNYDVEDYYKYGQFGLESFYQSIEDDIQRMGYEYECKQFLAEKN